MPLLLLLCLALLPSLQATAGEPVFEIRDGVRQPESVLVDTTRQRLIIANMGGGSPAAVDHNGYLAVAPVGPGTARPWARGLSAPKGMGIIGDMLVVTDIHRLVAFDLATGNQRWARELPGATFLNDIAVARDRTLYCSDMATNRIWRMRPGREPEPFVTDPRLDHPNGLTVDGQRLLVATWGGDQRGRVVAIGCARRTLTNLFPRGPFRRLDGIVAAGPGHWLVTDNPAGTLLRLTPGETPKRLWHGPPSAADLAYLPDRRIALIPIIDEDRVVAVHVR